MIQVVLVFTESGDVRFFKFYDEMPHPRRLLLREQLIARVHRRRERGVSGETFDCADLLGEESFGVYRQVGSLTVLFGADGGESPLFVLDLIDAFVHALRSHFGQSDRQVEQAFATRLGEVSGLLDEMVQGGLVLETDPHEAVRHLRAQLNSGPSQQASPVKSLLSGLSKKLSK